MKPKLKSIFLCIVFLVNMAVPSVWADWLQNGTPICTAENVQDLPMIISDGAHGAVIVWLDGRRWSFEKCNDIWAQRINGSGDILWTADGVALCMGTITQRYLQITSDGAGGAIVAWPDNRDGNWDIYAERVDASGDIRWGPNGIGVCKATGDQQDPMIASDGEGGAIVTWCDDRNGYHDIYAQRINAAGVIQWTENGIALCMAVGDQDSPKIISDGAGGAIVAWQDRRPSNSGKVYAQRVNSLGAVQWLTDGVVLCTAPGGQINLAMTPDGVGGAIITWDDYRGGTYSDIYAQRVDASGTIQWTVNGVALCTAGNYQILSRLVSDGAGGAIATWRDLRNDLWVSDLYAQRVNSSGEILWPVNGVAICTATRDQWNPVIASDGANGAIITWEDYRDSNEFADVYAQRVNASGEIQWAVDGVSLSTALYDQMCPAITSDDGGGAIIAWRGYSIGSRCDIYAQRIDSIGSAPPSGPGPPMTPEGLTGTPVYANNCVVALFITWNPNIESNISHYEVCRDTTENFTPGLGNILASPCDTFLFDIQWRWFPHYYYKVAAVDSNGYKSGFALLRFEDVSGMDRPETPEATYLSQNYPNPFNPSTTIEYYIPEKCFIRLEVFDISGKRIVSLIEREQDSGSHLVTWNGKDGKGRSLASGIYFYRLIADRETISKKLMLLK